MNAREVHSLVMDMVLRASVPADEQKSKGMRQGYEHIGSASM